MFNIFNRSTIIAMILLAMSSSIAGCNSTLIGNNPDGYIPFFKIIGDVEKALLVRNMEDFETVEIQVKDEKRTCLTLQSLIDITKPLAKEYELLLVGQDGLIAKIDAVGIEECYIGFSAKNAWEFINPKHPVSSNIKEIREIVLVSKQENWDYGVNFISSEENIMNISPGNLYCMPNTVFAYFEGKAAIEHQGDIYETSIYTEQKIVRIKDLISLEPEDRLLAMGSLGEYRWVDGRAYLRLAENRIDLLEEGGKKGIQDVKGIILNPPETSVMNTFYDAQNFLEKDEKVLILFIDGFGYHQYFKAINNGYAPFLKSLPLANKATTVYKCVTNAGFAAMITGKSPEENGVYSRAQRELKVPSIFALARDLGKSSVLIEGDIKILNTEIEPILNLDTNNSGTTDEEVFETSIYSLDKNHDLIMVHFHGVDDMGHNEGDLDEKTMERIALADDYIKELAINWKGKIIITSDHGMHSTDTGGDHGSFLYQDMIVPYLLIEGGDGQ